MNTLEVFLNKALKLFLVFYILALIVWIVGALGLFGFDPNPLSGILLVLLGLPWVHMVDFAPKRILPIASAISPIINLGIIFLLSKLSSWYRK